MNGAMHDPPPPFLRNALEGVRQLAPYEPGMPIEELQRRLGVAEAVKLASNENPLGISPKVRAALEAAAAGHLERYPDGSGFRLKRKLAALHGIEPERITLQTDLFSDLDLDSIDAVDLAIKLQEITGRRVRPQEFKGIRTVADVVATVRRLLAG